MLSGVIFQRIRELPSAGVSGGEVLGEILRHPLVEFGALFQVCGAEAVAGAVTMGLAVDAEMF